MDIYTQILSKVDIPLLGALIWTFNHVVVKRTVISTRYIPWITLCLGAICALVSQLAGDGWTGAWSFIRLALLYGAAAFFIQSVLKRGTWDMLKGGPVKNPSTKGKLL